MSSEQGSKRISKSSSKNTSGGSQRNFSQSLRTVEKKQVDPEVGMSTPSKKNSSERDTGLSPAPTEMSSPGGASMNNQTLTIEHNMKNNGSRGGARSAGLIFGMSKPVLGLVIFSVLGLSGGLAYFLAGWLEIPGLNTQIERLEAEVGRLSGQVDRLESENDRYGSLNDNLNYTVQEIQDLKDQLNATTNRLDVVSQELNATNYEFSLRIDELMEENQEYAMLNAELNATSMELSTQVDRFHGAIAELILENAAITDLSDELADLTGSLQGIGVDQNATIAALELTLREIVTENSRLEDLNKDLATIVSFLNDTSAGLDDSLQQVTQFLAGQITANRVLVLGSIESNYRQKISNWDCDYRDVFREFDYGFDYDTQIPQSDFEPVVSYVNVRVLEEMCLSDTDFADYVSDTYPSDLTSARLITAVTVYTTQALDWYFPESSEEGVSSNEWSDAGYQCENLPNRFVYNDARTRNRH